MLLGLIRFTPLDVKSVCPQTLVAVFAPDGNLSTRLLPVSTTITFPLGSTATAFGAERELADASGEMPAFEAVEVKLDCPRTLLAAAPVAVLVGNTKTRLSEGTATYRLPELSTAMPAGPAMLDAVGCSGRPRVVKFDSPHTPF